MSEVVMEIKRGFLVGAQTGSERCHSLEGGVQLFIDATLINL